jgi:hypothetical protein
MLMEVAPALFHCNVLNCPAVIVGGVAVTVTVGGAGGLVEAAVPPQAVSATVRTIQVRSRQRDTKRRYTKPPQDFHG